MTGTTTFSKNNIALIGFMGSGKTSAGMLAARLLGKGFLDTDEEIIRLCGMTVPEIFAAYGEEGFREREADAAKSLAGMDNIVAATGGGFVKNPENARVLRENALVIYLKTTAERIFENTRGDIGRPLLNVADPRAKIAALLTEREPLYAQAADVVLDCAGLTVEETAKGIAAIARRRIV